VLESRSHTAEQHDDNSNQLPGANLTQFLDSANQTLGRRNEYLESRNRILESQNQLLETRYQNLDTHYRALHNEHIYLQGEYRNLQKHRDKRPAQVNAEYRCRELESQIQALTVRNHWLESVQSIYLSNGHAAQPTHLTGTTARWQPTSDPRTIITSKCYTNP
jgi:hypothetical protein